ncbi:hypothetical protein [Porticoccus sp.]
MAIKVLLVLDGVYRFEEPAASTDFTYTTLVSALTSAGMQVTRAHRNPAGDGDIADFNFATSADLLEYDLLWLIGFDGRNAFPGSTNPSGSNKLEAAELGAIAQFMDAGGGVFATGDHDSIGADMCGYIPRVRTMRAWFGEGDGASPMPADFPRNFPVISSGRADTVQKNPLGDYDLNDDGMDESHVYFENQSDSIPQPITPTTSPAHPILRRNGMDITVYPDHMHEGQTLGEGDLLESYYTHTLPSGVDPGFVEFPVVDGQRETPKVIATGQVLEHSQILAASGTTLDPAIASAKTVNTLCVYDGREVGVGRVVTGATFHHYIDINLTGSSDIDTDEEKALTGADAVKGQGYNYPGAEQTFADIKAVYVNIAKWLARPRPAIGLILERSTFSQDEVGVGPIFEGAILVTVDGLKPSQFPGGPIDDLTPSNVDLNNWAPEIALFDQDGIALTNGDGIRVEATGVDSDMPTLPDQLQRFTFTYRIRFVNENAFGFVELFRNFRVDATLTSSAVADPLTDSAWMQLVKSANPFMLDLDGAGAKTWLSSDVRVFPVVEGETVFGQTLPANASKSQAYTFVRNLMASISVAQFESLSISQAESTLSPFPTTTGSGKKVYNFAIARVRLNGESAAASQVRVFFRIFVSQTTAALTYRHPEGGVPLDGYKQTAGANPIAVPGVTSSGDSWLSFPFFSENRAASPGAQTDDANVQDISPNPGSEVSTFFGALLDNNLSEPYLPPTPLSGDPAISLSDQLMGEHQCIVAQIEYSGTPIPDGAKPSTSDKLAQRNLAMSAVANPGLDASRMALHTFEIEAAPGPITETLPPDELLLEWLGGAPDGIYTRVYIPSWNAREVVELADRIYPRHGISVDGEHTVIVPGGGTRYIPLPRCLYRQTGVVMAEFPLGIKKGQRFDLAVRQISNRSRDAGIERPKTKLISAKEAQKLLSGLSEPAAAATRGRRTRATAAGRGTFDLGDNRTLVTNLALFDMAGDGAVIVQSPDPEKVAAARRQAGLWRETVGSFQLGVPVSVKDDMLLHHLRLLSVLRWRAARLRRDSRWYKTFIYYLELIANKVQALGGNPFVVPATPDGHIGGAGTLAPGLPGDGGKPGGGDGDGAGGVGDPGDPFFEPGDDDWLEDSSGLGDPGKVKPVMLSGKVSGLLYDHFGDFEGFTLESYGGRHVRLYSRESEILKIAERAWLERYVVTVLTVSGSSRRVRRILTRGYSDS